MSSVLAVVNNKGGVGKTTLVCNLGHCLALRGKRVLVVDLDSQCNSSSTLLPNETERTIYELFTDESLDASSCIFPSKYEKLDVLPCAPEAFVLESELSAKTGKGFLMLRDRLMAYAKENYDVTIMDCPPNLGMFAVQALVCADNVIVPIECGSKYAIDGLTRIIDTIHEIRDKANPGIQDIKLLINKLDRRTTLGKLLNLHIRKVFSERVFTQSIPVNSSIQQAEMAGETVMSFAPSSSGAFRYGLLAKEFAALI